jgi:hypothetical protein
MAFLQTSISLRDEAIAIFRELLADDDIERELLELANPRHTALTYGEQISGCQKGLNRGPDKVGRFATAFRRYCNKPIILCPVKPD